VRSIRPGFGLHPMYLTEALEKVAKENLEKGDRLELELIG
jgi:pseudaminic acid synthase